MSDKIPVGEISIIGYQQDVTSGQHRQNYANVRNRHNALCDTVDAVSIGTTNAETTAARPYHNSLGSRLNVMGGNVNKRINGGEVLEQATPDMTARIKAVTANVGGIAISRGYGTFTRVTTTATITEYAHGFSNGDKIYVDETSSAGAIPATAEYIIANVATNTFDITCTNGGDTSGSIEYSRYTGTIVKADSGEAKLDYVVLNSDASITVVVGLSATSPLFPAIGATQLVLGCIVTKFATTSLNDGVEIFNFIHSASGLPDRYIGSFTALTSSIYYFNNIIIDAGVAMVSSAGGPPSYPEKRRMGNHMWIIKCKGNYFETANAAWTKGNTETISNCDAGIDGEGGDNPTHNGGAGGGYGVDYITDLSGGDGGDGGTGNADLNASSGGGGGGGASLVSTGGDGGNGDETGIGGVTLDAVGGTGDDGGQMFMLIATNATINGNISCNGDNATSGANGTDAGGGGGGGAGGGLIMLIIRDTLDIASAVTYDVSGGNGGNGGNGSKVGGGGGGAGAGGVIWIRYGTIANSGNLTTDITAGSAGAAGTGGSPVAGGISYVGLESIEDYTAFQADLFDGMAVFSGLPITLDDMGF